ncbi:SCO family protein [Paraglaciecola psychrophila]|uniref:SCO family protein n=1 Tax=Paraglaciecola psychrophila TaxID=326544 RepID=UPI001D04BB50
MASFFFSSCPGICPSIRTKLNKVQEKFLKDADVKTLQHSIRPNTDTVATLKNTLTIMASSVENGI